MLASALSHFRAKLVRVKSRCACSRSQDEKNIHVSNCEFSIFQFLVVDLHVINLLERLCGNQYFRRTLLGPELRHHRGYHSQQRLGRRY